MKKKYTAFMLVMAMCLTLCINVSATENGNDEAKNKIIDLACTSVEDCLEDYYYVTDVSGEITNIETVEDGVKAFVTVSYTTMIRAETADDAPYIRGILAAMEDLTDETEIQKANDYLTIWRGELERDHIGKELRHSVDLVVFTPEKTGISVTSTNTEDILSTCAINDAVVSLNASVESCPTGSQAVYIEEPMSSFVPTAEQVATNARNDIQYVISDTEETLSRATRASNERAKELDRVAAAKYAKDENNFPVGHRPDGTKYAHYSSDCANFVSQCYSAGGVKQVGKWYEDSSCWKLTGGPRKLEGHYGITDYMLENNIVFHGGTGSWNRAFAGSIMYYPKSLTKQAHVGIVTSNDGQTAYYSAHTTDHCNKIMTAYYKEVMDFYIPVWDSHTGTWTKQ